MIKIKSIGYQTEYVLAEIEYDLEGELFTFTVQSKLLQIEKMRNQ